MNNTEDFKPMDINTVYTYYSAQRSLIYNMEKIFSTSSTLKNLACLTSPHLLPQQRYTRVPVVR